MTKDHQFIVFEITIKNLLLFSFGYLNNLYFEYFLDPDKLGAGYMNEYMLKIN